MAKKAQKELLFIEDVISEGLTPTITQERLYKLYINKVAPKLHQIRELYKDGKSKLEIAKELGINKNTFYECINNIKAVHFVFNAPEDLPEIEYAKSALQNQILKGNVQATKFYLECHGWMSEKEKMQLQLQKDKLEFEKEKLKHDKEIMETKIDFFGQFNDDELKEMLEEEILGS